MKHKTTGSLVTVILVATLFGSCENPVVDSTNVSASLKKTNSLANARIIDPIYQAEYDKEYSQGYFWGKREVADDISTAYIASYKNRLDFYSDQQIRYPDLYVLYEIKANGLTDGWLQAYLEIPATLPGYAAWFNSRLDKRQRIKTKPNDM